MSKEIAIFGVGRSGTTTLYNTLQKLLWDEYGGSGDFYYEPFLWRTDIFNKLMTDISMEFTRMDSVSYEGIYANKCLPMLVSSPQQVSESIPDKVCEYLQELVNSKKDKDYTLVKFIRANGRAGLFHALNEQLKSVFVIRNPIDVINSSIGMFSFYGDDFHESDWDRFIQESRNVVGDKLFQSLPKDTKVEREAFYWYINNLFFLNNTPSDKVYSIVYEDYVGKQESYLQEICDFLSIKFNPALHGASIKPVGEITQTINLSTEDLDSLLVYYGLYLDLVGQYFPNIKIDTQRVFLKYRSDNLRVQEFKERFTGYTPVAIRLELRKEH